MANETPQDASQLAINLVDQWYFGTNNATMISPADRTVLYQRIAAAVQAERDRHAAEVAQTRIRVLVEAAFATCEDCRAGTPPTLHPEKGWRHITGTVKWACEARHIRDLVAAEEKRYVSP